MVLFKFSSFLEGGPQAVDSRYPVGYSFRVCLVVMVVLGKVFSRSRGGHQMFLLEINSEVQLSEVRVFLKERVFSWSPVRMGAT